MKHTMVSSDAQRRIGISGTYLRRLDDVLLPERAPNGHRRYDPERVERYAEARRRGTSNE